MSGGDRGGADAIPSRSSTCRSIDLRVRSALAPSCSGGSTTRASPGHLLVFLPGMAEIRRAAEPAGAHGGAVRGRRAAAARFARPGRAGPGLAAGRPAQGHPEHERRGDLADDRRGPDGVRQRPGPARPVRSGAQGGPLVAGADQPGLGRSAGGPGGPDGARPLHPAVVRAGGARPARVRGARDPSGGPVEHAAGSALLGPERPVVDSDGSSLRMPNAWTPPSGCWSRSGPSTGEPARITPLGRRILELPVHPRLARLLLAASDGGRRAEGAAVAALLSEKDIRATRRSDGSADGPLRTSRRPRPLPTSWCDSISWLRPRRPVSHSRYGPAASTRPPPARSPSCAMSCCVARTEPASARGGRRHHHRPTMLPS